MKQVAQLLNGMARDGVIRSYAVFGAVAQMRYTEAVATLDADILVSIDDAEPLAMLAPIYAYCRERGYEPEGEAIRVGDWPVQFVPVYDTLTQESVEQAETGDMDGEPLRVVRADHLALMAIKTGRTKDYLRVVALLEAKATTEDDITSLAAQHDLSPLWQAFQKRYL